MRILSQLALELYLFQQILVENVCGTESDRHCRGSVLCSVHQAVF